MAKKLDHKNLIRDYDNSDGQFRSEVLEVFEGCVSDQNVLEHEEVLELVDKNNTPYRVSWRSLKSCDFGHLVGGKAQGNKLVGRCYICGAWLCSARGCCFSCRKCGKVHQTSDKIFLAEDEYNKGVLISGCHGSGKTNTGYIIASALQNKAIWVIAPPRNDWAGLAKFMNIRFIRKKHACLNPLQPPPRCPISILSI